MMILPSGYCNCAFLLRIAMARARVTGPTLPANMVIINHTFPAVDNVGVMPVDKPTVPNAEVTSNKTLIKLTRSVMVSAMVTMTTKIKDMNITENAL